MKVREWGPAGGAPLVFWPGLTPFGELQLVEVGPLVAQRGFHVQSIVPPFDLDDADAYLPSRLAELVLSVAPERFAFMGHSWGGSIGVQLAADHPDRVDALVLLDSGYRDVDELPAPTLDALVETFEREQQSFAFDSWDDFVALMESRRHNWRPALEERYRAGMVERNGKIVPAAPARAAAWALHGVATEKQTATHARLDLPILLLLARDADAGAFAEKPNVETVRIDAGHDIAEDAPQETARVVADWLESALARTP